MSSMAEEGLSVNLKVLSPSPEVEGGITLADLPASTTVKELRSRIQDAIASRPAPERMRLIYRGRVVANDADTLEHVFSADGIRESKDQSLHLVLRELPSSSSTASSSASRTTTEPANPFRPLHRAPQASPLQTNPFRNIPQPQSPSSSSSQPQIPQPHQQDHHHHQYNHTHGHQHQHLPGPGNPFVIPVPPHLQQHLAQAQAQFQAAQMMAHAPRVPTPSSQEQQSSGSTPPPTFGPSPPPGLASPAGPQNAPGRTVRQEGIGPNGERWSVTVNEVNLGARSQHPLIPPQFGLPPGLASPLRRMGSPATSDSMDRVLTPIRTILERARREMQNVTTLFQLPEAQQGLGVGGPPNWRLNVIRDHVRTMSRDLDTVERGLEMLADPLFAQNADVAVLRQSVNDLRSQIQEMNRTLARTESSSTMSQPPTDVSTSAPLATTLSSPTPSAPVAQAQVLSAAQTLPSDRPAELFILSSPQGPVGVLFDQRGTYATAPLAQTLPFQTFTDQFARNRQLIAGLGQHIAQGSNQLHSQLANIRHTPIPTPTQQPVAEGSSANQTNDQPQVQNQNQNQNQNQQRNQQQNQIVNGNANQAAANGPAAEAPNDMANIAGHLWLLFKLACFVYFFSGGASLSRMMMLGVIAVVVYLAQIGIFDSQFNLVRRHFEALLPVGALADQAAQPRQQPRAGGLTPEQAAQRLLQQQREQRFGWAREGMRTLERSFALFAASLWPGVGERMVHAQEERLRLERVAASEERERQEEARRQEAEAQQKSEENKDRASVEEGGSSSARAEREKAEPAEGEASGSASASAS